MNNNIILFFSVSILQGCASYYSFQEGCSKGEKVECEEQAKCDYSTGNINTGMAASKRQRLSDAQSRHLDKDNLYPVINSTGVTTNCYRNGVDGSVICKDR